jgi:hypothetical protein
MAGQVFEPRPRKAVGPDRPAYLKGADVDRLMAVVLALSSEVASLRERIDAHERVAAGGPVTAQRVEAYRPDEAAEAEREAWREAFVRRLFRVLTEDVEAVRAGSDQS